MTQTGLRNSSTRFNFFGQSTQIINKIRINIGDEIGDHSAQQNSPITRGRFHWKRAYSQRYAASGRMRSGTKNLEFGQEDHRRRVLACPEFGAVGAGIEPTNYPAAHD